MSTISDVAKRAGVSPATVSRVIQGAGNVRPDTRDKVQRAIENQVRISCARLAPGGGYVLGASGAISDAISPENFVAMSQAVHKYGRYGALGLD